MLRLEALLDLERRRRVGGHGVFLSLDLGARRVEIGGDLVVVGDDPAHYLQARDKVVIAGGAEQHVEVRDVAGLVDLHHVLPEELLLLCEVGLGLV